MKRRSHLIPVAIAILLFIRAGVKAGPATAPATQPARYTINLTNTTAEEAVKVLAQEDHLPLMWNRGHGAEGGRFDLQMENATAPQIIAELCRLGSCQLQSQSFNNGGIMISAGRQPPLLRRDLKDGSVLLVTSSTLTSSYYPTRKNEQAQQQLQIESVLLNNPANAPVAVQPVLSIHHFILANGQRVAPSNYYDFSQMESFGIGPIRAWPIRIFCNLERAPGPIVKIQGDIREWMPLKWAQCQLDDLTKGKTASADGIQITLDSLTQNQLRLSFHLAGPTIDAMGNDIYRLVANGAVQLLDDQGEPMSIRCNANKNAKGWTVQIYEVDPDRNSQSPASLQIKLPQTVHEIVVPIDLDVSTLIPS